MRESLIMEESANQLDKNNIKYKKFDPFQSPPDIILAKLHIKSRKIGIPQKNSLYCPCCNNHIDKNDIDLWCKEEELSFLGSAYPLYFRLIKYFSFLIIIMFFITGSIFYFLFNLQCQEKCVKFFGVTILNLDDEFPHQSKWVNILSALILTVIIFYTKQEIFKDIQEYEDKFESPKFYTLLVQNIPSDATKQEIEDFFAPYLNGTKVVKLNLIYQLDQYNETFQAKLDHIRECNFLNLQIKHNSKLTHEEIEEMQDEINSKQNYIDLLKEKLQHYESPHTWRKFCPFIGTVFISFERQEIANEIFEKYGVTLFRNFLYLFFSWIKPPYLIYQGKHQKSQLRIKRAAAPDEILWDNLQYSFFRVYCNSILMIVLSLLLLYISFQFQFWVMKQVYPFKKDQFYHANDTMIQVKAITVTLVVIVINIMLRLTVYFFTKFTKLESITSYYSSYINKYVFLYFANTAFMPFLVHASFDSKEETRELLIKDIHFFMLASSLSTPFVKLLDFDLWIMWTKRWMVNRFSQEDCPYPQIEVHQSLEYWVIDICDSYAYIGRTLFLCAWYARAAPFVILYSLFGLLVIYWVDKIHMLRYQSAPESLSVDIFTKYINIIEIVPLVFIMGSIEYDTQLTISDNVFKYILDFIGFKVSSLFYILMFLAFIIYFPKYQRTNTGMDKTYTESKKFFNKGEYAEFNPITQKKAKAEWIKEKSRNKQISEIERQKLISLNKNQPFLTTRRTSTLRASTYQQIMTKHEEIIQETEMTLMQSTNQNNQINELNVQFQQNQESSKDSKDQLDSFIDSTSRLSSSKIDESPDRQYNLEQDLFVNDNIQYQQQQQQINKMLSQENIENKQTKNIEKLEIRKVDSN